MLRDFFLYFSDPLDQKFNTGFLLTGFVGLGNADDLLELIGIRMREVKT